MSKGKAKTLKTTPKKAPKGSKASKPHPARTKKRKENTMRPGQRYCLFKPKKVVATPKARKLMRDAGVSPESLFVRHIMGDWGDLTPEDAAENWRGFFTGERILSAYHIGKDKQEIWLVTEPDRKTTTFILPEEY